jgi:hypothetical protein
VSGHYARLRPVPVDALRLQQGHAQAWSGACPGGFAVVSRSLLMLTPGDDTSPLKRRQHLMAIAIAHEIVLTTSTSVLESDGTERR